MRHSERNQLQGRCGQTIDSLSTTAVTCRTRGPRPGHLAPIATTLPPAVREVVALVICSRLHCAVAAQIHPQLARAAGLDDDTIADLLTGGRPENLDEPLIVACHLTHALFDGGRVPEEFFQAGQAAFGDAGLAELVHQATELVTLTMLTNTYDIPAPEETIRP